jgi:hypothetical protein
MEQQLMQHKPRSQYNISVIQNWRVHVINELKCKDVTQ